MAGQGSSPVVTGYGLRVLEAFRTRFATAPVVLAYAPGRIEVLGNHTDYNHGFVLSAAINLGTYFFAAPRQDDIVTMHSLNMKVRAQSRAA
jgi:galactokinase